MLVVDLSALSTPEIRRLLNAAEARRESSLVDDLRAELGVRGGGIRPSAAERVAGESRCSWAAPTAGLLVAALVAVGSGLLLSRSDDPPSSQVVAADPIAHRAPAPRFTEARALAAPFGAEPPRVAVVATLGEPTAAKPERAESVRPERTAPQTGESGARAPRTLAPLRAIPTKLTSEAPRTRVNLCYHEATPADRLVCGYPALAARHRRLREAYLQALTAGADPESLGAEQAAWTARRDQIADRTALADAYAARIAALDAAAEEARAEEPVI